MLKCRCGKPFRPGEKLPCTRIEERRSPGTLSRKELAPARERMSHALTSMCVAQIFLDSCSDRSGNSHGGTGGVESYFLCLSRALSDRTCRAFYFPAHIAAIGWQLRRSRPPSRTAVRNPEISRTLPTVACSAVQRSRALCGSSPKMTGKQLFGLSRPDPTASSQARRGRTGRRDCSASRRCRRNRLFPSPCGGEDVTGAAPPRARRAAQCKSPG